MAICTYCLRQMGTKTRDHVFPSSWFPTNTPVSVQRWTVPTCNKCNNTFSKIEKELLVRIGICLDPKSLSALGLPQKALATLGVNAPIRDEKERARRETMRRKIMSEVSKYDSSKPTLPGFGPHKHFPLDTQIQVKIEERMLKKLIRKVVRGAEYKLGRRTIHPPQRIKIYFPDDRGMEQIHRIFKTINSPYLGPGFSVQRAHAYDKPNLVLYKIIIWGRLTVYAAII